MTTTTFTNVSQMTGREHTIELFCTQLEFVEGMLKRANGALIQDAFPMLPADQREFIMTGITSAEWNEMFGATEEEEQ